MIPFLLALLIANQPAIDLLNQMADRYAKAPGIQWTMESVVYSPVFEETETTPVKFAFNPPDTFFFQSAQEEIIGIADTVWVMSKRHRQIQKKIADSYLMPTDLIINWDARYDLDNFRQGKNDFTFELAGHDGIIPDGVMIITDKNNRLKKISYKDSSGDEVTLTVRKERLKRSSDIDFFYKNVPSGYQLIDLTE